MQKIILSTLIHSPRERLFDLARSIDAHVQSAEGTRERAVDGVTHGLIGLGEEVTWEVRHFGVRQRLKVRITEFVRPVSFQDVMVTGAFRFMRHGHVFHVHPKGTMMVDTFQFESPFGILGGAADFLMLRPYLKRFLVQRNRVLKHLAESEEWKKFVPS